MIWPDISWNTFFDQVIKMTLNKKKACKDKRLKFENEISASDFSLVVNTFLLIILYHFEILASSVKIFIVGVQIEFSLPFR